MTMISFPYIRLRYPRTQICLLELDRTACIVSTTKQNINNDTKLSLSTDRLFLQRLGDNPQNTELFILIKIQFQKQ